MAHTLLIAGEFSRLSISRPLTEPASGSFPPLYDSMLSTNITSLTDKQKYGNCIHVDRYDMRYEGLIDRIMLCMYII